MLNRRHSMVLASICGVLGFSSLAQAQATYPDRPIKIIVALPAGGSADMIARTVGQKISTILGQPVVVENRAGGSGQIGTQAVARAANLHADQQVRITVEGGRVIIEPLAVDALSLEERLKRFDPARHGGEVMAPTAAIGAKTGAEKW